MGFSQIYGKKEILYQYIKKEDKTLINNYRTISLLPIFGKIFERVIYNSLFNYFLSNRLFTPSQSRFLPKTHVLLKYYQQFMKYKLHLLKIPLLM